MSAPPLPSTRTKCKRGTTIRRNIAGVARESLTHTIGMSVVFYNCVRGVSGRFWACSSGFAILAFPQIVWCLGEVFRDPMLQSCEEPQNLCTELPHYNLARSLRTSEHLGPTRVCYVCHSTRPPLLLTLPTTFIYANIQCIYIISLDRTQKPPSGDEKHEDNGHDETKKS